MDNKDLSLLGKHTDFFHSPEEAKLEAFPNRSPQRRYVVTLDTHEFSSLCPVTGQPDSCHLTITYCPAEKVVETAKTEGIKIVALSGVLTLALDSMKATVDAIKAAGLDCKVIIGGAPVSAEACKNIGADEWAHSPQKTVATCRSWAE